MPSTRAIKTRIRSVRNTKQITKAMQLVAASKMRRAQENSKASDAYTEAAREILQNLSTQVEVALHPLFVSRAVKKRLVILIAADKGLAGAYNTNVFKLYTKALREDQADHVKTATITIGRKAAAFVAKIKHIEVFGSYTELPDKPNGSELIGLMDTIRKTFVSGEVDAVDVIYTDFVSSISQVPTTIRVLPAGFSETPEKRANGVTYEPSVEEVLDGVAFRLVEAQIFQALLDSRASEHSMRMIAMKNATDNASDLVDDLTLEMNKARQGAITQELAEISGGVEAMKE